MKHLPVRRILRAVPLVVAITVVVPAMVPTVVSAQSVDQQRERVEDIVDELERLEEQALRIGEDYADAIDTKSQLDVDIAATEARIAEKEVELGEIRSNLSEMARRSFVGGGAAPLGPLFEDADNLNDALQREELAKVALSAGDVTTDQLDALVDEITAERESLDAKRTQAEQLAESLVTAKADTESLTAEYTDARADAEAKLGELVAQEEQRRAEEALRRIQAESAAASRAASSASATSSGSASTSRTAPASAADSSGSDAAEPAESGSSGAGAGFSAPAPSSRSGLVVQAALAQQGVPYRYATSSPGVGFDCSGLTAYAWAQAGVGLPHQSRAQFASTPRVPIDQAQPGDLLFFYSPISHVSIYIGNGQHVHAPSTGKTVSIGSVSWGKVVGVGRPG